MLLTHVRSLFRRQDGQTLVEYALILTLVAIFLIGALTFMRTPLASFFSEVGSAL
jgi:Flp pilus assembly pilin Flp